MRAILDRAAALAPPEHDTRTLDLVTVKTGYTGAWSREEIYGGDDGR